jgi:hypothetical protein
MAVQDNAGAAAGGNTMPVPVADVPIKNGMLQPTSLEGLWRLATILSGSAMVPDTYRNKPQDTFVALSWGMELGLSANNSLHSIAVINGKPGLYGDVGLALVRGRDLLEDIDEHFEGEFGHDDYTAVCIVKRKGEKREHRSEFSVADAKRMGKWNKPTSTGNISIWQKYPKRMLKWRARWFALRDVFGDVLKGLGIVEEMQDSIDMEEERPGVYSVSTTGENSDSSEKQPVGSPKEEDFHPPAEDADAYVNPANADDEYVKPQPEQAIGSADPKQRFIDIIGPENAEYGDAFVDRAAEINGCSVEEIYQDFVNEPTVMGNMFEKWMAKFKESQPTAGDAIEPEVVPENEEIPVQENAPEQETAPEPVAFDLVVGAANNHYGSDVGQETHNLLRQYMDYITGLNGMNDDQIHAGLKANPGEWFEYFEGWYDQEMAKNAEAEAKKEPEPPVSTEEMQANLNHPEGKKPDPDPQKKQNDDSVVQNGKINWITFKQKWNTMPKKYFKDYFNQNLEVFKLAKEQAVAIDKRAREKWAGFYPDDPYPADATQAAAAAVKTEANGEVDDTVQNRWNYINSKYPEEVKKAVAKRKMASGGLSRQAMNMIIDDVVAAVGM